jgi:Leucine-rich repeat (LRR) protein
MLLLKPIKLLSCGAILSAFLLFFPNNTLGASRSLDSTTLVGLYDTCGGPNWTNHTNWKSTSVLDNWYGVTMSAGRVSRLSLGNNGLRGSFPKSLINLTALKYLALDSNQLSGSIPDAGFGNNNSIWLSAAETLWIQQNQISGSFPTTIVHDKNLKSLRMNNNQLSGSIVSKIDSLKNLTELYLNNNQLSGSLPLGLGNLASLKYLCINSNSITGSIPDTLKKLTNLITLRLDSNQMTGSIPSTLGNDTNLQILYLDQNQLSGSLPSQIGNLTKLTQLYLNNNQLSSSLPTQLGNLTSLTLLYLNNNLFSGSLPTQIGNLTNLTNLYLNNNQLSGSLPTQLGNLTSLTQLYLNNNQISGSLPSSLGNLTGLQNLYLSTNSLTGSIPDTLKTLTKLICLTLNDNQLSDTISSNLGNDTSLQTLYLQNNQLTGSIPTSLGSLSNLTVLRMDNNALSGRIPSQLGNLAKLVQLHLEKNLKIKDTIPSSLGNLSKLAFLYLYSDSIYGAIPSSLGNLGNLMYLDINNNQISDTLPSSIGSDTNLVFLNLRHNQLSGIIPSSFGNLVRLTTLNLGCNQLSGSIPSSIGNITSLPVLFLDSNQLSSSIPSSIGSLTSLDSLSLRNNLLTGTVPSLANLNASLRYLNLSHDSLAGINSNVTLLSNLNFLDVSNNQICAPPLVVERWLNVFDTGWQTTQRSCTTSTVTTLDSGLVAYWNFNEGTGNTAYDSYKRIHNGTLHGASWTTGISGSAVNFQGNVDSIIVPSDSAFDLGKNGGGITISAWIRTEGSIPADSGQFILTRWQGIGPQYSMYIHNDKKLAFDIGPAPVAEYFSDSIMPNNTWLHVVVTHVFGNSTTTKLYLNGSQITGSWTGNGNKYLTAFPHYNITIGYSQDNTYPWWFHGQIDDLRLYKRAISAAEVDSIYNQQGLGKRRFITPFAQIRSRVPAQVVLAANTPNPFKSTTNIQYGIPEKNARVLLQVFDAQGKIVQTLEKSTKSPGYYLASWNGCDSHGKSLGSGIYIYKLTAGAVTLSRKMVLSR